MIRGVRGATTVSHDSPEQVLQSTTELLKALLEKNTMMNSIDIASVLFTVTSDIVSAYPAKAAREMGWQQVPLLCAREIPVEGSLPYCIRVLIHWNTELSQEEIKHVYLNEAVKLRPDFGD